MDSVSLIYQISVIAPAAILAITLHEAAHGYVALRYGDPTARDAGRLTLNPFAHIDPVGTVLMPGMLLLAGLPPFGYAKPVPVDFMALRSPKQDMVWVAAAGPAANIVMAIGAALLLNLTPFLSGGVQQWVADSLYFAILINLVLAVFNMIPLPPLDGGRVAVGLLPVSLARPLARLERFGIFIVFGLLLIPFLLNDLLGTNINILGAVIWPVVELLRNAILGVFFLTG